MPCLLEVRDLRLSFGGIEALAGVSLDVATGETVALVGPNGSGKTSLFNCITALYRGSAGTIAFAGESLRGLAPNAVACRGIARTFQDPRVFPKMSVLENLLVSRHRHFDRSLFDALFGRRGEEARQRERCEELIQLLGLEVYRHQRAGECPYGVQKRVDLGRALATEPRLLLLDEPVSGLTAREKDDVGHWLHEIKGRLGIAMLLVEHDLTFASRLAGRIIALDRGLKIAEGTPEEVVADENVRGAYLGRRTTRAADQTRGTADRGTPLLSVSGIETRYSSRTAALAGVSLEVAPGEIVAVLGPNGAGKTTLLRSVAGLIRDQPSKGTIELAGRRIERRPPEAIARLGIACVPQDQGLFRDLSVAQNLELGLWGRRSHEARAEIEAVHALFPVLRERASQRAGTLSGGEQRMLALGRALLRRPRLLMLDEPSQGLAPPAARLVFEALLEISREGTAILLVEQNARLAMQVAQHIVVLEAGHCLFQGSSHDAATHGALESSLGLAALDASLPKPELVRENEADGKLGASPAPATSPIDSGADDPRLVRNRTSQLLLAAPLALLLALPWIGQASWLVRATMICVCAISVLGQDLLIGRAGQMSLGQAGFLAIGAYTFGHLRIAGIPFLLSLLAAGLAAALVGVLVGLPSLRLKGPYLAIATLAFGVAAYQGLGSWEALSGGRAGLAVPMLTGPLPGLSRGVTLYYACAGVALGLLAVSRNLARSYVGRAFVAVRDGEMAAAAVGLNVSRYKLLAFALSSFYTGVGGALLAQFLGHLEPQGFTLAESVTLLVAVVVGGMASTFGPVLGAAFVILVPALFSGAAWAVPLTFGTSVIAVMLLAPAGLAGLWAEARRVWNA